MSLLAGLEVAQLGGGLAAAVCGRLFADVGARVVCVDPTAATPLARPLNHGKTGVLGDPGGARGAVGAAGLIVCEGQPRALRARGHDPDALRRLIPGAAIVTISPFGQTGPEADDPATDLTLLFASGIARMLT